GHGRLRFEQSLEKATSAPQQSPVRTRMEMLLRSVSNMLWRASGGVASAISRATDGSPAGSLKVRRARDGNQHDEGRELQSKAAEDSDDDFAMSGARGIHGAGEEQDELQADGNEEVSVRGGEALELDAVEDRHDDRERQQRYREGCNRDDRDVRLAHGSGLAADLSDPVAESPPADRGGGSEVVEPALRIVRVIHERRRAAQIGARYRSVVAAVDGVIAIVAHHEIRIGRHDERSPLVQARRGDGRAEARVANLETMLPGEERLRHVGDGVGKHERIGRWERDAVDGEAPVPHDDRVSGDGDDALDQDRRHVAGRDANGRILRRRDEHRNVAAPGRGVSRERAIGERDMRAVAELVDEQPVADEQGRLHAGARDAERFGEELAGAEEDGDDREDAEDEGADAGREGDARGAAGTRGGAGGAFTARFGHETPSFSKPVRRQRRERTGPSAILDATSDYVDHQVE